MLLAVFGRAHTTVTTDTMKRFAPAPWRNIH